MLFPVLRLLCNFNPRSREGSDFNAGNFRFESQISIHAPAKGATRCSCQPCPPARHFNPRSREGSDPPQLPYRQSFNYFNPRSREGSDPPPFVTYGPAVLFQSTLPRRERQSCQRDVLISQNFNPRSREGSDAGHQKDCKLL